MVFQVRILNGLSGMPPYFDDYTSYSTFSNFKYSSIAEYLLSDSCKCICVEKRAIGMVSKNWIDKSTRWLEIGIVICNL